MDSMVDGSSPIPAALAGRSSSSPIIDSGAAAGLAWPRRVVGFRPGAFRLVGFLAAVFLAAGLRAVTFLREVVFRAAGREVARFRVAAGFRPVVLFRAVVFRAVVFRAVVFRAVVFRAAGLRAAVFLRADVFLAVVFLAVVFLAVVFLDVPFLVGPLLAAVDRLAADVFRPVVRLPPVARFLAAGIAPPSLECQCDDYHAGVPRTTPELVMIGS